MTFIRNPRYQVLLILGLLCFSAGYLWFTFRYETRAQEMVFLSDRALSLTRANQMARRAVGGSGIDRVRAAIEAYVAQEEALRHLLPSDSAAAPLLPLISETAREYGIVVSSLAPGERERGDRFDTSRFAITVQGRYHDIGAFLAALGNFDQIIHTRGFKAKTLAPAQSNNDGATFRSVEAAFEVHAFFHPTGQSAQLAESSAPPSPGRSAREAQGVRGAGEADGGTAAPRGQPQITYERDDSGRIWQMVAVPGRPTPVRVPVTQAGKRAAEDWLSRHDH
jgi:type IV pilus assembly protein PilO